MLWVVMGPGQRPAPAAKVVALLPPGPLAPDGAFERGPVPPGTGGNSSFDVITHYKAGEPLRAPWQFVELWPGEGLLVPSGCPSMIQQSSVFLLDWTLLLFTVVAAWIFHFSHVAFPRVAFALP